MLDSITVRRYSKWLTDLVSLNPFLLSLFAAILCMVAKFGLLAGLPLAYALIAYAIWVNANYAFEVIAHRAMGADEWPVLSIEALYMARLQSGLVFSALMLVAVTVHYLLDQAGMPIAAELFAAAAIFVLPASAAVLAVTRSPLRCVNPAIVLATVPRIGLPYLTLLAALWLVSVIARWAARDASFISIFLAFYSLLLFAYLIGSILYARRGRLGQRTPWSPEALAEQANRELIKRREGVLSRAYGFAAHENVAGALKHIEEYAASESDSLAALTWLFQRMTQWEDGRPALRLGAKLVERLASNGRDHDAAKVNLACDYLRSRAEHK